MDFWGTVQVLRRRWHVVVPALLIGALLTGLVYASIPTRWQSTGVMVLTTPSSGARFSEQTTPEEVVRVNPLLAFDGSLTTTAQILAQILRDPTTAEAVGAGAGTGNEYLANNGELNGPFVFVTANSDSNIESQALVGRVLTEASKQLDDRQRALQAPASTFIKSELLIKPTAPEGQIGGKIRFAGAAMVLSIILALASAYAADSIATGRARRRTDPTEPQIEVDPSAAAGVRSDGYDIEQTVALTPRPAPRPMSDVSPAGVPMTIIDARTPHLPNGRLQPQHPIPEYPHASAKGAQANGAHHNLQPSARRPRPTPEQRPAPSPRPLAGSSSVEGHAPVTTHNGNLVNGNSAPSRPDLAS